MNAPVPHPVEPDPAVETDLVPGDPPVPVNTWRIPATDDTPVGDRLAARLLVAYTRRGDLVYDTLPADALRKAAKAAGRGYRAVHRRQPATDQAALAVTAWPPGEHLDPVIVLGGLRRRLRPGGVLALILTEPTETGPVVAAATTAGLSYLQHVVTMPTGEHTHPPEAAAPDAATGRGGAVHARVHGDLLVFSRTGGRDA